MGSIHSDAKECTADRISELPDDIRWHILSFMPTRDAVKTCALSHQWRNAWLSVPSLDVFVYAPGRSAGFVDRVFFFRGLNYIHKFRLKGFGIKNYYSRTDVWIEIATTCNVVELDLDLLHFGFSDQLVELPRSIFVCKTLVVLKMKLGPNVTAIAPTSDCFPTLKYLDVTLIRPRVLGWIEKLFASCPQLEDLIVFGNLGSLGDSDLNITLSAPKLRRLKLSLSAYLLGKDFRRHKIFINGDVPNLENLDLKENCLSIHSLNTKSLNSAKVVLEGYRGDSNHPVEGFADRIHKSFLGISSVRYLSLSAPILGYVDTKGKGYCLPRFKNLSQLELHHQTCCVWELLIKFLNASPNLETLVFQNNNVCPVAHDKTDLVNDWNPPEAVPVCLSSCLKTICIRGFKGNKGEIYVIEYLLKHGQVLDMLTIYTSDFWKDSVMKFWQKWSKFQMAPGCKSSKIEWKF